MIHIELANAENTPEKFHDKVRQTETYTGTVVKVEGDPKKIFYELLALLTFFEKNKQYRPLFLMALMSLMNGDVKVSEQIDILKEMEA